jgi:transposase-like protein
MGDDHLNKRPQDWSAEEKLQAVMDAANLNEADLGEYCRRNGLHTEVLEIWRETCLTSIRKGPRINPVEKALQKEIKELKRDLRRKEKALAEATALLILKKKAALIWGTDGEDEGD